MNIPLIKIIQKNEYIYSSKLTVKTLKNLVYLNFRYPYINTLKNNKQAYLKFNDYLQKLLKKGLQIDHSDDSVQRVLQIDRINSISNYIKETNNFLPNSIILGCFNKHIENQRTGTTYEDLIVPIDEKLGLYKLDLNNDYEMIAIDGQHRLAPQDYL